MLSSGEKAIFDFISLFTFFMSNMHVRPSSSSLIYVSRSTVHSIVVVVLWHPGREKLPKAQDCWVHQKFGVVLFFEVPAAPSWKDLGFHL